MGVEGPKIAQASLAAPIPPAKPTASSARRPRTRQSRRGRRGGRRRSPAVTRKGWMIQIGATDDAAKASALLARARERDPKALAAASPSPKKCRKATPHSIAPGSPASIRLPPSMPAAPSNATDFPALPPTTDAGTFALGPPFSARSASALSLHQNILGLIDPRGKSGRAAMIWVKLLHQRSVGSNDLGRARAFRQPQNFVGFPVRHRAAGRRSPRR